MKRLKGMSFMHTKAVEASTLAKHFTDQLLIEQSSIKQNKTSSWMADIATNANDANLMMSARRFSLEVVTRNNVITFYQCPYVCDRRLLFTFLRWTACHVMQKCKNYLRVTVRLHQRMHTRYEFACAVRKNRLACFVNAVRSKMRYLDSNAAQRNVVRRRKLSVERVNFQEPTGWETLNRLSRSIVCRRRSTGVRRFCLPLHSACAKP